MEKLFFLSETFHEILPNGVLTVDVGIHMFSVCYYQYVIRYRLTRPARDKPEVVYVVIKEHKHMQIFELFSSVYTPHGNVNM